MDTFSLIPPPLPSFNDRRPQPYSNCLSAAPSDLHQVVLVATLRFLSLPDSSANRFDTLEQRTVNRRPVVSAALIHLFNGSTRGTTFNLIQKKINKGGR